MKTLVYIYLLFQLTNSNVEAEALKTNSYLDIDVYTSDLRAITNGEQPLQCISGEIIEYLRGGLGTNYSNGSWNVTGNPNNPDISLPFELDYKLNNASGCIASATPTTPAWQGSQNIGTGNGAVSKNIYTGIPLGTTTFTLNCVGNSNNYNLTKAVTKNDIELAQMYNAIVNIAINYNQVFVWNILTNKIRTHQISDKINIPNKFLIMFRQLGDEIYMIPSSQIIEIQNGEIETNPKYSTMLMLSENSHQFSIDDININNELSSPLKAKDCLSYSPVNKASINASIGQNINACDLTGKEKVYLSAVVFQK